jgi:hypothetical protein
MPRNTHILNLRVGNGILYDKEEGRREVGDNFGRPTQKGYVHGHTHVNETSPLFTHKRTPTRRWCSLETASLILLPNF